MGPIDWRRGNVLVGFEYTSLADRAAPVLKKGKSALLHNRDGSPQCVRRVAPKARLKISCPRIRDPGQNMARARKRQDVIAHVTARPVPLDQKAFFTRFHVPRQRSISESKSADRPFFIHDIDDSARVQGPQANRSRDDRDRRVFFEAWVRWRGLDPTQIELLPTPERGFGCRKNGFSLAEFDSALVESEIGGRRCRRRSHRIIGEIQRHLSFQKSPNTLV